MWKQENFNVPIAEMYGRSVSLNKNRNLVQNAEVSPYIEANYQKDSEELSQKVYLDEIEDQYQTKKCRFAICPNCRLTIPVKSLVILRCPHCGVKMNLVKLTTWKK